MDSPPARQASAAGVTQQLAESSRHGRGRDYSLLWAAQTTSAFGTGVSVVALPLIAVTALGASTFQVGLVATAGTAAWLVFGLPSGVHVDRVRRRPLLLWMDVVRGFALASVPVAWAAGVLSLVQLGVVALVVGSASVYFDVALQAYLPAIVAKDDLVPANSKLQGSESAAQVGGPALGGLLVQALGAPAAILADVGSYVVSVLCTLRIRHVEDRQPDRPSAGLWLQMREGLRFVRRHPVVGPLTVSAAAFNFAGAGVEALAVVFLTRTVTVSPAAVGALLASLGLGGVVGAAVASRLSGRLGSVRTLHLSVTAGPLLALLLPLTFDGIGLLLFAVGAAGISAFMVIFSVLARSYRQVVTPPELLGRVTATVRFLSWGMLPVGALAAGTLGQLLGNRSALLVMCLAFLLTPLPIVLSPLRQRRDLLPPAADKPANPKATSAIQTER